MQNLTGKVEKLDPQYFAFGGIADIFKGAWRRDDGSDKLVRAQYLYALRENFTTICRWL